LRAAQVRGKGRDTVDLSSLVCTGFLTRLLHCGMMAAERMLSDSEEAAR
jgi:hypothetical protein